MSTDEQKAINKTLAWGLLKTNALVHKLHPTNLRHSFAANPQRASEFSVKTEHLFYDFSRQLVDRATMKLLFSLAKTAGLPEKIQAMFSGLKINVTEGRAVLHTALRQQGNNPVFVDGQDVIPEVKAVLTKVKQFSDEVHSGQRTGMTGKRFKNIISIGIGGSYLGPEYLAEACRAFAKDGLILRFVANVDGTDFAQKTADLDPAESLFVIVSKTFTTAETMKNAATARNWLKAKLGDNPEVVKKHVIAVSTAEKLVSEFGIDPANMFGFWDWVGGRFSAASAVGAVPLSLFLGYENFEQILKGAAWLDEHFLLAPLENNIPVIAGLIDIWNINFLGYHERALLPYAQALLKLAPHTQQVEMESNGKRVDVYGRPVAFATGEVVFGEPGTNGQHSFYQLIHQGMVIPADFIAAINSQYQVGTNSATAVDHQRELLCNFLAQPDALAFGKTADEVREELVSQGKLNADEIEELVPHKVFPGNRPSSSFLINQLTPFTAGLLLALTEHRTVVKGFVWGINSFDQWGVELGKQLGVKVREQFLKQPNDPQGFNPSTGALFRSIIEGKLLN
ncbi:glucose-6-phosphate isomerase [candidate division WOR-1 bacterium RIFOXYB2_FULL_48_7]|uniref:Glucose-6-phosphate isomerase n=1 Tax=candidate division WOR-1 bacterium RIFOXYB2_FULL_48_7 TaxID=1802583 RepID=A0A1F4T9X7_UNCSA|nr:MAG: glucose-6-phosphate isomerase [candidate division WOR-1 bacterium RIFOXYB2_FULL_48_7]